MSSAGQLVIPMLSYENGVEAMNWLCKSFGFLERTKMLDEKGRLAHGEIAMGTSLVMLASPTPDYQSPAHHRKVCAAAAKWSSSPYIIDGVLVFVDDVKKHFQTAKENGAVILSEIEEGGPGTRYRAEDLEGHRWMFMERNGELK